ncbi:MAG TPA: AbrB/MazE/SpoVT family DNA-binding domain-containing protein [Casimicrobiaceae bacterium]
MATAILSSKGQITIPLPVRQKLGVTTGDRVEFVELDGGGFALVPAVEDVRTLKGIVSKSDRPVSIEEMRRIVAKRGAGR